MFLYLAALFPSLLLFSIYRKKNKITIAPPYLVLFEQTWLIFYPYFGNIRQTWSYYLFYIYRGKDKLTLIQELYGKLGRVILSSIQGKVHYLILFRQNMANLAAPPPYLVCFIQSLELIILYSIYREKDNIFVFILFSIGKKTIFKKI